MKKIIAISVLALLGFTGAYKANAQLHNMGLQMSMIWPKGNDYGKNFNSLYGGLFYEYRFQGKDEDVNELMDHFGLEFGINYTEFIFKKSNYDLTNVANINLYKPFFEEISNVNPPRVYTRYAKSSNKGVNFYAAPKAYLTIYPDLVEMYLMGKVGYQYLKGKGTLESKIPDVSLTSSVSSSQLYFGAFLGFEVKLGTVSVGTNFGFDNNTPQTIMNEQKFSNPFDNGNIKPLVPFKTNDKIWGNLVLEFKVKAQLNGKD